MLETVLSHLKESAPVSRVHDSFLPACLCIYNEGNDTKEMERGLHILTNYLVKVTPQTVSSEHRA